MQVVVGGAVLELALGDITRQEVEAIVNAANHRLAGGGGVDGAIHRRGGPAIMEETERRYPQGCPTGSAVVTAGGNLAARYVIHAVGPVWQGGHAGEPDLLRSAFLRSMELADELACLSIALPALSTGAYNYPLEPAAEIALTVAHDFLQRGSSLQRVVFVLFDNMAWEAFRSVARRLWPHVE